MFDKFMANLDETAGELGLSPDQLKTLTESFSCKLNGDGDQLKALIEVAEEHGVPVDTLKAAFQRLGSFGKDAPAENLAGLLAKGLFGGKR